MQEEPSYKSYQYLHDYAWNMAKFLQQKNTKIKLYMELQYLRQLIQYEVNIRTNRMNYPLYFTNFDEYFNCFIYECSKYKFPREIKKSIHQLQKYQMRHRQKR